MSTQFMLLLQMGSPLIIFLSWILLRASQMPTDHELGYSLETYYSPGIYFENMGQATLYNTEWKTIVYIPWKPSTNQIVTLEQYDMYISKLCSAAEIRNWTECIHFGDMASDKLQQLRTTKNLLIEMIDRKTDGRRVRRGVFNFVGEISKVLFGTMNDDDAQYYNEQIKHFEQNSDRMTHLLRQQLCVVKSSLGAINETLSDMEYNEAKVRKGLIQLTVF
jgi:hypothetical protein